MIVIQGLTKTYADLHAVDDVSLTVSPGEAVALWGPNGAGKTTVIRCILGLASFTGSVRVAGYDVRQEPKAARSQIGHVPQELAFYSELTVAETIDFSARLKKVAPEGRAQALETVGMAAHRDKTVGSLSGGMKQRLAIGLALLGDPPLLLLDEPTSNLDAAARDNVVQLLHDLRTPHRSILLTSHHVEEIGLLADRAVIFENGRVVLECDSQELSDRLGLKSWLHVRISGGTLAEAAGALVERGLMARPNRRGVLIEVSSQRKGAALDALEEAGYQVVDFEVWR